MPIIKSAKKRVKQTRKATVRNSKTKKTLKVALKSFTASLGGKNTATAHSKAQSAVDKAAKKGVIHKNKAARKKRQLALAANKSSGTSKTVAKKAPAKKVAAKKTAAKKPAAKKSSKK